MKTTESKDKREAVALRQRRYRMKKQMEGFTRLQLYVPSAVADQLQIIADELTKNPSLRYTALAEATKTNTLPLTLTQKNKEKAKAEEPHKYRNPKNPAETWSGSGRKPVWLKQWLGLGYQLSEFEIKEQ